MVSSPINWVVEQAGLASPLQCEHLWFYGLSHGCFMAQAKDFLGNWPGPHPATIEVFSTQGNASLNNVEFRRPSVRTAQVIAFLVGILLSLSLAESPREKLRSLKITPGRYIWSLMGSSRPKVKVTVKLNPLAILFCLHTQERARYFWR